VTADDVNLLAECEIVYFEQDGRAKKPYVPYETVKSKSSSKRRQPTKLTARLHPDEEVNQIHDEPNSASSICHA
jgi:hypothetical protein